MGDDTGGVPADTRSSGGRVASGRLKRHAITLAKWAIAVAALWYVGREIAWRETASLLADVGPPVIAAVLVVTALEFGSRFSMWWVVLNARAPTSLATTARIDLVIKFVNHVLPSKASGHSVAPVIIRHYTDRDWTEAVTAAGVNTGLYASLYGLVAALGVILYAPRISRGLLVVLALSTGLYLAAGVVVLLAGRRLDLAGTLVSRLERAVGWIPRVGGRLANLVGNAPSFTAESASVFRDLSSRPSVVAGYALGWAGTLMVFPAARVLLVLTALGGSFAPVWTLPIVLVLAYSVTILPLTPGGVGVAEASATLVLSSLGVPAELAVAVVVLDRALGVYLPALLGWLPVANLDLSALLARDG